LKVGITGTNSGLGKSLAETYAAYGYEIIHINRTNGFNIANPVPIVDAVIDCDIFINCVHLEDYQSTLLSELWNRWEGKLSKRIINIGSTLTIEFLDDITDQKKKEYYTQKLNLEITHRKLLIKNPAPRMHLIRVGEIFNNNSWDECAKFIVQSLEISKDNLYLFEIAVGK
jgi:hypothetical protein